MAFFLEATFVGLFFFGWNRLSPVGHLAATWLLALGTNLFRTRARLRLCHPQYDVA